MAIQMRRGAWSQFDPTKMLPGEWAVILSGHPDTSNGQALYHCFAAGSVKQIATIEDAATIIANATEDIREELTQDIASALAQVGAATNAANAATANANAAATAANTAANNANTAAQTTAQTTARAEAAIDAMGDISEQAVPEMSADVRGGAKLEQHGGLALRDGALGIGSLVQESDGYARGGLAEVTAKGHAEQDGTPTPDNPVPIEVVRGRNLLDEVVYNYANGNGFVIVDSNYRGMYARVTEGETYTVSREFVKGNRFQLFSSVQEPAIDVPLYSLFGSDNTAKAVTVTIPTGYNWLFIYLANDGSDVSGSNIQVELGSTPQPYVPYGHVGMEVKADTLTNSLKQGAYSLSNGSFNPSNSNYVSTEKIEYEPSATYEVSFDSVKATSAVFAYYFNGDTFISSAAITSTLKATMPSNATYLAVSIASSVAIAPSDVSNLYVGKGVLSTTSIPLPQRGWVAGLRDGTADALTLDGAGKCEWELADAETTTAATDGVTGTIGVDVLSTTGQIADGATVLYKLATPIVEDCGYVEDWPTDIPEGATVTIPELDAVGIRYFVDSTVTELARQWYERANSEYADRITALEQAVAELATS